MQKIAIEEWQNRELHPASQQPMRANRAIGPGAIDGDSGFLTKVSAANLRTANLVNNVSAVNEFSKHYPKDVRSWAN